MTLSKSILCCLLMFFCLPLGQANIGALVSKSNTSFAAPPVEKNKPVEKRKKAGKKRLKKQKGKTIWKTQKQQAPDDLRNPALTFWLIFGLATLILTILGAFIIGLGLAPWSVALYVLLGANIASFLTLFLVIWVDKPGDPAIIQFIFALFGLIAINAIIGISFIIWGLAISWVFGWMIGLVLLGLAGLFLGLHLILAQIQASKE